MKKITIITAFILCAFYAMAQNGELPPTYFNGSTNICDNSSWKLVFQDDFNGNSLKSPWITFLTYRGQQPANTDNSEGARSPDNHLSIFMDDNVVVSNGTVKLKIKKEETSWHCSTCAMQTLNTNYSSSALCLPYTLPFNNGKFEARIKFPTFRYAHCTFWTWATKDAADIEGVDEIDIAEGYGLDNPWNLFNNQPVTDYSLHAWPPGDLSSPQNPYNLQHEQITNRYPGMSWWNYFWGTGFHQDEFHNYTCEWNPNVIRFYVDGDLINTFWKYYKNETRHSGFWPFRHAYTVRVGSTCVPASGNWKTLPGYPWKDPSYSNLRFTTKIDQESDDHPNGYLGQMEIDYVKIWQRHPENGWVALCDVGDIIINGPDEVCDNSPVTFTASNSYPTGYWEVSPNLSIVSSNSSSVSVIYNGQPNIPGSDAGYIKYFPTNQNCPETNSPVFVKRNIVAGKLKPINVIVSRTVHSSNQTYGYNIKAVFSEAINKAMRFGYGDVAWDIDYGPNYSHHYHTSGTNVLTPYIPYLSNTLENLRWTLKITNPCGTTTIHGGNYYIGLAIGITSTLTTDAETGQYYVSALITNEQDYHNLAQNNLFQTMIPEYASDTATVEQLILNAEMEALAPYLVLDTVKAEAQSAMAKGVGNFPVASQSSLFPNPVKSSLSLTIGKGYEEDVPIEMTISDNLGRVVFQKKIYFENNHVLTTDVDFLKEGIYFLNLKQKGKVEHFKFVKIKD